MLDRSDEARARFVKDRIPPGGLFAGMDWRLAPRSFPLESGLAAEFERLGRILLQFYRSVNLLYRHSLAGKQPAWIAGWLELGKPGSLVELQRSPSMRNALPRVIRPDILLTDSGYAISELDSVPGGIGLTGWLNSTYAELGRGLEGPSEALGARGPLEDSRSLTHETGVIGGPRGMIDGFAGIFGTHANVHVVVSEESSAYRPEMVWLCDQINRDGAGRFHVRDGAFDRIAPGSAVYRFFELFDLPNVPNARRILELAAEGQVYLTPPPKPVFEEKMLFALLWNRHLRGFWRQELGQAFLDRLLEAVPYTWVVDPAPLPPHAAIPELGLTDWQQLKALSQRDRQLILKISGFSDKAWGARGVYLGSDLSQADWSTAVDEALMRFPRSPYILQRYHKPRTVEAEYYDFEAGKVQPMRGRARLCPYYFVVGEGDEARPRLGGVLATICPADKKIIHGMKDAILSPCRVGV